MAERLQRERIFLVDGPLALQDHLDLGAVLRRFARSTHEGREGVSDHTFFYFSFFYHTYFSTYPSLTNFGVVSQSSNEF